jgi:hypothetical protein
MSIEEKLVAALQAVQGKDLVIHTIAPITHSNLINLELPVFVQGKPPELIGGRGRVEGGLTYLLY